MTLQESINTIIFECNKIEEKRQLTSKDVKGILLYQREAMEEITKEVKKKKVKK